MEYFETLGRLTGHLWKAHNYDERTFPEVANEALRKMPASATTSLDEIVRYVLRSDTLPHQADLQSEFGQPPLTVYVGRDFRIEVLFWTGATPAVHQHAFSGAFHVLHGSSLHLTWDFEIEAKVSIHLRFGRVSLREGELLKVGDIRPILAGDQFIHTTFHLETPTISIVVRTNNEPDQMPQYTYLPPTICYNPREDEPLLRRKAQVLAMLVNAGRTEQYDHMLKELLAECDTCSAFHYLFQAHALKDRKAFKELLETAKSRHTDLVLRVDPAFTYARRQSAIANLRAKVKDPDVKFLLAVLINVPDRKTVLTLLKDRFPGEEPIGKFVGCMKHLSDRDLVGEKFNEPWLWALHCLLADSGGTGDIERAFASTFGGTQATDVSSGIENLAKTIRAFWLLRPLLETPLSA